MLKVCGASEAVVDECALINRRINGQGSRSEGNTSVSQSFAPDQPGEKESRKLSYAGRESMIAQFERLVTKAIAEPLYKPNETDLQAATLTKLVSTLRDRNKAVKDAVVALRAAQHALNGRLYGSDGIHGQASAVKQYIRVIFGYLSPEHRQVCTLKFQKK